YAPSRPGGRAPASATGRHRVAVGAVEERRKGRPLVAEEERLDLLLLGNAVASFHRERHITGPARSPGLVPPPSPGHERRDRRETAEMIDLQTLHFHPHAES